MGIGAFHARTFGPAVQGSQAKLDQEGVADMSKPWDGEETPLTNAACLAETWPDVVLPTGQVPAPFARDLERRCRNAEKLLDECRSIMAANGLYPITQKRVSAHLAAAAQEDGK